jgi:ornithine cyclodeaminase/alanine dehydrogenase-like protein (mu-crystallin family)
MLPPVPGGEKVEANEYHLRRRYEAPGVRGRQARLAATNTEVSSKMPLILSAEEVEQLVDLEQAIHIAEQVAIEQAAGTARSVSAWTNAAELGFRLVAGGLFGAGRLGIGLTAPGHIHLLYRAEPKELLAIIGYPLGTLRAAASAALGAKYLAPTDAHRVAVIGSRGIARAGLRGVCAVRRIEHATVYSRQPEHRQVFADEASRELSIPVVPSETLDAAVEGADVIVCATNSAAAVVHAENVRQGVHLISMGLATEIGASVYARANRIAVTSVEQEQRRLQVWQPAEGRMPVHCLLASAELSSSSLTNVAALVRGEIPPRTDPRDITVFRESRGAANDVALANFVYERARHQGLGVNARL